MSSAHRNNASLSLLQSIESDPDRQITKFLSANMKYAADNNLQHDQHHTPERDMLDHDHIHSHIHSDGDPLQETCGDSFEGVDAVITMNSTTKMAGQSVAPFLAKHIPDQYAPLGGPQSSTMNTKKDPNTKFCYRHRPDSKCRRTADEPTMEILQRVCVTYRTQIHMLTYIRTLKHYHKLTNKAYRMSGHCSPPLLPNTEILCYKAFCHNAAFHNYHTSLQRFEISSASTSSAPYRPKYLSRSYVTSIRPLCVKLHK